MADDDDVPNKPKSYRPKETFHRAQEAQVEHKFPYNSTGIVTLPPGSRGPRSLYIKRHGDSFGFTLRHFIVYPPDAVAENDGRHAAVGALSAPMDTIFVKHVKEHSPAKLAGLQCGDRLVAINRIPVTDKTYSQVVHLIQNSPEYLHLLVVPKEEDILQRFFSATAYNPASNQQNSIDNQTTAAQRFLTNTFNQQQQQQRPGEFQVDAISWRSLQNPLYNYNYDVDDWHMLDKLQVYDQKSTDNLLYKRKKDEIKNRLNHKQQEIYSEINTNEIRHRQKSRAQPQVPLYKKMGRRASDGCTLSEHDTYYELGDCSLNSSINSDIMVINNNKMKTIYNKANYPSSTTQDTNTNNELTKYTNVVGCRLSLDAGCQRRESSSSLSSSLVDGSKDSLNSFDSTSTLTGHETDDSAIMNRYRKSFQQKEEFLKMPNSNNAIVDATLIQREFYGRPKKLEKSMWPPSNEQQQQQQQEISSPSRVCSTTTSKPTHQHFQRVKNDIDSERDLILQSQNSNQNYDLINKIDTKNLVRDKNFTTQLNKIQENPKSLDEQFNGLLEDDVFVDDKSRIYPQQSQQIVHKRAKQFESGTAIPDDDPLLSNRTSFYRSELARLSSKRVVPNVTERAQEFEILSNEPRRDTSGTSTNSGYSLTTTTTTNFINKKLQRDSRSLESSGSSISSNSSINDVIPSNKKLSGNVMISSGSKYLHCPPPSDYGNKPTTDTSVNRANKIRARSNSAESWVAVLQNDKKSEINNKKINRQDAIITDDASKNKTKNKNQAVDISVQTTTTTPPYKDLSSPLIPEPVEHMQITPTVSITPVPSTILIASQTSSPKAIRPTQLDLEGPIRPVRHLKPPQSTDIDTSLLHRPISPVIGEDNKPVVVKRRTKSTNLADDERATRRESYLKATEGGRMHFDSDLSDGDISPQILRSAHRRWRPPMFPGDIQQLRKLFEEPASSLGGSISGNSSSSASLDREKGTSSPLDKDSKLLNIIKEGSLYCKITEIDGKRAGDRSWKQIWAALKGPKLFLYKDRHHQSPIGTSDVVEHSLSSGVDMRASVVRVADDYTKRKHVFRVSSVSPCRSEFLLQAETTEELADWVKALQEQMATTTDVEAKYDPLINSKQQAVPQTIPALTSIQVQGSSRLSPQPPSKSGSNNKSSLPSSASIRNRSPTGQSPVSKTRKPSSQLNDQSSTSPKSKTWRGRVVKQFQKIHRGASSPSSPTAPEGSTFGVPLDHCLASINNPYVPRFVEICTDIVDARGLQTVGIYRVPGNNASITALTEEINRNYDDIILDDPKWNDLHVVSSLLKSYFRKMPDSLVTNALYRSFMKAAKIDDIELRMKELKKLVKNLLPHNYHTLKHVILHLKRVVENSDVNKMDAKNLAIVFGPTIVRHEEENMENMVNNMTNQYKIVETLLTYADWFFSENESDNIPIPTTLSDVHEESEPVNNQALLLDNIMKYEALKDKEKNGALFSSIISAAQRKVKRKTTKGSSSLLQENKDEVTLSPNTSHTFSFTDLKQSTTTDGKTSVIPTTVTDMEKCNKQQQQQQQTEKVPWFNYSTDQEDFYRRVENFELETKAMLEMPRHLEISVNNIGNSKSSTNATGNLSSSAGNVSNQTLRLTTTTTTTKPIDYQQNYLTKTHSASNVFNRTLNDKNISCSSNSRNSLNSIIDNNKSFKTVQYANKTKSDKINDINNLCFISNSSRQQYSDNNIGQIERSANNISSGSSFIPSTNQIIYNNNNRDINNGTSSDQRRNHQRFQLRRGSSVENINSNSSSNDLNANGTMKKVKYENENEISQRTAGSLDSLNKFASTTTTDDEIDLVTSLTKLYDKKLKEEKHCNEVSLLTGEGLPYVDESSPEKLSKTNNNKTTTANIKSDKENIPNLNDLYRNPSLHKNQFINSNNNNKNTTKLKKNDFLLLEKDMDKDEDSTMVLLLETNNLRDNERHISNNNKNIITNKLKRSESLNKPERTVSPLLNSIKLKRSESLNKPNNTNDNNNKLKRSDSLTKTEKTENNLNKRRELLTTTAATTYGRRCNNNTNKEITKLKRKNGMPDRSIKRRHTVGGTKDPDKITWLDKYQSETRSTSSSSGGAATAATNDNNIKEKNLRTSSPDLSSTRRERLLFEINFIGPENMVVALKQHLIGTRPQSFPESTTTAVFKVPLESHV